MPTTSRPAILALLVVAALGACKRHGGPGDGDLVASGGDVQQDTSVHFGTIDTSLLTNGPGWVRTKPGLMPPNMQPQQLQAPEPPPVDSSRVDSGAPPAAYPPASPPPYPPSPPSPSQRGRRDTTAIPDTLRGNRSPASRDTLSLPDSLARPRGRAAGQPGARRVRPDTAPPDTTS